MMPVDFKHSYDYSLHSLPEAVNSTESDWWGRTVAWISSSSNSLVASINDFFVYLCCCSGFSNLDVPDEVQTPEKIHSNSVSTPPEAQTFSLKSPLLLSKSPLLLSSNPSTNETAKSTSSSSSTDEAPPKIDTRLSTEVIADSVEPTPSKSSSNATSTQIDIWVPEHLLPLHSKLMNQPLSEYEKNNIRKEIINELFTSGSDTELLSFIHQEICKFDVKTENPYLRSFPAPKEVSFGKFVKPLVLNLSKTQEERLVNLCLSQSPDITFNLLDTLGFLCNRFHEEAKIASSAFSLVTAFYKANPDLTIWEKFPQHAHGIGCFNVLLSELKVIHLLSDPLLSNPLIDREEMQKIAIEIAQNFHVFTIYMKSTTTAENFVHSILSQILIFRDTEGSAIAETKLKVFAMAFMPHLHTSEKEQKLTSQYAYGFISRAVHLDKDPITDCCKHLPITKEFRLTPIVLKTLIAEYAKNNSYWSSYILHRVETQEQMVAVIEAALELPAHQKYILLSAIAEIFKHKPKISNVFEQKGLKIEDYPKIERVLQNGSIATSYPNIYDEVFRIQAYFNNVASIATEEDFNAEFEKCKSKRNQIALVCGVQLPDGTVIAPQLALEERQNLAKLSGKYTSLRTKPHIFDAYYVKDILN